ncbi:MAG: CoA-binding protein [Alphaproteobacteria bacterium]|nr:CoA-binding protein [Alphaproteobacteria bacterium]
MPRDVETLVRPKTVAVIGASSRNQSQGNIVIGNLTSRGFPGAIIPVHPSADTIEDLPAVASIVDLPDDVDLAVASVPASAAMETAAALDARGVRSAIFFAAGFTDAETTAFQNMARAARMNIHGPNCMGLINGTDDIFLYPAKPTESLHRGPVSLIAQSGSAAISVINAAPFGFAKIVTVGSEFQITAADYLHWFAGDDSTTTVGIVLEDIKDPTAFASAAEALFISGKSLAVLNVGRSQSGAAAARAHTGAMTSAADNYELFFRDCGIPVADDYDELIASLQCLAAWGRQPGVGKLAIAGISGGQTALACDVAESVGTTLTTFSDATTRTLQEILPGTPGQNPIDLGAVVGRETRNNEGGIDAILASPETDILALIQDSQTSLNERSLHYYLTVIAAYCQSAAKAGKPIVAISPSSQDIHPEIRKAFDSNGIPIIRGLREGLVGIRSCYAGQSARSKRYASDDLHDPALAALRAEIGRQDGQLTAQQSVRLLDAYGIPTVKSVLVRNREDAAARATEVGFPLVVKVASGDIAHRSELGGVVTGVQDVAALEAAIATIEANVRQAAPQAEIDGYELQTQFDGDLEAVAGFVAAPPFGSKIVVGTGGTLVELYADRALGLAPLSHEEAVDMIAATSLGKRLAGYRNLIPETDTEPLAELLVSLSELAQDFGDLVAECDLNPVMIRKGTGEVMVVDVLMTRCLKLP